MKNWIHIAAIVLIPVLLGSCDKHCEKLDLDTAQWAAFPSRDKITYTNGAGDTLVFMQAFHSETAGSPADTNQADLCHAQATTILMDEANTSIISVFIDKFRNTTRLTTEIYLASLDKYGSFSISSGKIDQLSGAIEINGRAYETAITVENPVDEPATYQQCILAKGYGLVQFQVCSSGEVWTLVE